MASLRSRRPWTSGKPSRSRSGRGRPSSGLAASTCCSRIPAVLRPARCSPSTMRRGSRRLIYCCSARCAWCARSCPRCGSAAAVPSSCRPPRRSRSRSPTWVYRPSCARRFRRSPRRSPSNSPPISIRVNQIIPGRVDTDRVRQLDDITGKKQGITPDQAKQKALANIPLGRYGEPPEFGRVAAFLLSDAAALHDGRHRASGRRPDQGRPMNREPRTLSI